MMTSGRHHSHITQIFYLSHKHKLHEHEQRRLCVYWLIFIPLFLHLTTSPMAGQRHLFHYQLANEIIKNTLHGLENVTLLNTDMNTYLFHSTTTQRWEKHFVGEASFFRLFFEYIAHSNRCSTDHMIITMWATCAWSHILRLPLIIIGLSEVFMQNQHR